MATQMPSSNVVLGGSAIQISISGDYELNFTVRVASVAVPTTVNVGVRLNGGTTFFTSAEQNTILSLTDETPIHGSVIVAVGAGAIIDLAIQATAASTVSLTGATNATLSAKLIMLP